MTNKLRSLYKPDTNTCLQQNRLLNQKLLLINLILWNIFPSTALAEYTSSTSLTLVDRIDQSNISSPWIFVGKDKNLVNRVENTIGCKGTNGNGAPARVSCDDQENGSDIVLAPAYFCPRESRNLHVGEAVTGSVKFKTYATDYSDGLNPDGCETLFSGTTQILVDARYLNDSTRNYFITGIIFLGDYDRWACPTGNVPIDIDHDGNEYDGSFVIDEPLLNPEACGLYSCSGTDSYPSFVPNDPKAGYWFTSSGYVCIGDNTEKQPSPCLNNKATSSEINPTIGNPIIIATSNKYQIEPDYQSQKPFGLGFTRFYNSNASDKTTGIGKKWHHNHGRHITVTDANAKMHRGNGQAFDFNNPDIKNGGTQWQADADISDTLVEVFDVNNNRSSWIYTTANDVVELYNLSGQLQSISNRQGQTQFFIYNLSSSEGGDDNRTTLDKITGILGDTLSFSYDTSHKITRMTDPQGQHTHYSYDEIGNLSRVTYPDSTEASSEDNPSRKYHYENADYPHHLTGITDENNTRYVTWTYNEYGEAISSEHAGGTDKETLEYNEDGSTTVTNSLGKKTTYHFTSLHGVRKVTKVEGHATESCLGANQAYTYDENGYLGSKTDWQGIKTTYQHNAKGLELSHTEAKGTSEARTITTQWHTQFRLPIKITEPGKITEFSYDDQGRLLSQSSRDTK